MERLGARTAPAVAGLLVAAVGLGGALLARPPLEVERQAEPPPELLLVGGVAVGPEAAGVELVRLTLDAAAREVHLHYRILELHRASVVIGEGPAYLLDPEGHRLSPERFEPITVARPAARPIVFADPAGRLRHGTEVTVVLGEMVASATLAPPPSAAVQAWDPAAGRRSPGAQTYPAGAAGGVVQNQSF